MPFKSLPQARKLYATNPALAKEFALKTDFSTLPEHVKSKKTKKKATPKWFNII